MLRLIYLDLCSYSNSYLGRVKIILLSHTFHLIVLYRLSSFFVNNFGYLGRVIGLIFEYIIRVIYSSEISSKAIIGGGLQLQHGMNIVIGNNVKIGLNCKIYNSVTLGNKDVFDPVDQQPTVGDNVVIASGAKCLGGINIGNNVIIGANSVVLDSIDANMTVVGIPARVINKSDKVKNEFETKIKE